MASGVPFPLRLVGTAVSILGGGFLIMQLASSAVFASLSAAEEAKQRKFALPCRACKGKGFYTCKLCKGNSTIKWSPLYDPVAINPCLCPTCDGNGVQRCLNCIGKGYF